MPALSASSENAQHSWWVCNLTPRKSFCSIPLKPLKSPRSALYSAREPAVELSMAADPNPDPYIARAQRDGSKVSCDSYRPCARIAPQPFQLQARMRRILQKFFVSVSSGDSNRWWQRTVELPKFRLRARNHQSLALTSGKLSGARRNCSSVSSSRRVSSGRCRSSRII